MQAKGGTSQSRNSAAAKLIDKSFRGRMARTAECPRECKSFQNGRKTVVL